MNAGRAALVVIVGAGLTAGIGWLSRAPYTPPGAETGVLRLSWRLRGANTEVCRARTPAELEALPLHMRMPEICESRSRPYRLVLVIDGGPADTLHIEPGGARRDRPVFVMHETPLAPGEHRVRVVFAPSDDAGTALERLEFVGTVAGRPGEVQLITIDDSGTLVHRAPTPKQSDGDLRRR